jgi:recombination protein RecA
MAKQRRRRRKASLASIIAKEIDGEATAARVLGKQDPRRVTVAPSGIDSLNVAIGIGGWPEGRLSVLHGPEGGGKTTLALHAIAQCQRRGGQAVFLDAECKLDYAYAEALGVRMEDVVLAHPHYIEAAFEMLEAAIKVGRKHTDSPLMIVWDSLNSLPAKYTFDNGYDKESVGPESRAFAKGFKKFMPVLDQTRTAWLAVSQVRLDISGFMPKENVAVGKAARHRAAVVVRVKPVSKSTVKHSKRGATGHSIQATLIKNQVSNPFTKCAFKMQYGLGVDRATDSLDTAVARGLLEQKKRSFVGKLDGEDVKLTALKLRADPELHDRLSKAITATLFVDKPKPEAEGAEDE